MENNTIPLIIILVCIMMSAYFSATETAFSSLNRIRIKNKAVKGNKRAVLVLRLSENYDGLLSTILIGNNIVNILSASLTTVIFVKMLGEDIGASISTIITTVVVLIFGEISPKSIAKESPEKFAMLSAPLLNVFIIMLTPANFLFKKWKKLLSLIFKASGEKALTEEELITIVEEAEQGGGIDKEESALIRSAIEFNEQEAIDVITPRIDVTGVSAAMPKKDIAKVLKETGYSRLPVFEKDIDHIVGILYQKDFYNFVYHTEKHIRDIIKPVIFTTKHKKITELIKEMQQTKMHFAVVVDEFGSTTGIVTLEDILEELVGEIWDEHDKVVKEIEILSENEYIVCGKTNVEKLFEHLHKEQSFDALTVNGWIMETLGRIPSEGDSFERGQLEVTVIKMLGKRVEKVRIIDKSGDGQLTEL